MATRSARRRRRVWRSTVQEERSAGGVVVRLAPEGVPEVVLIATHGGERWSLPKGHIEPHERPEEAAAREVEEETGVRARVIAPLETVDYWYRWKGQEGEMLIHKYVHFFLMAYEEGDVRNHGWEVDDARWVPLPEAIEKVTYKDEKALLEKALALLKDNPHLLERHAPEVEKRAAPR